MVVGVILCRHKYWLLKMEYLDLIEIDICLYNKFIDRNI